jgi:HEPN domain-containing protein
MPGKESRLPGDWFARARADLRAAEILLAHGGDTGLAGMHIQQAVEKHLKGYLLSKGWALERIHDLPALLDEAAKHFTELEAYRAFCEEVTSFYFEARYPFPAQPPTRREAKILLRQAQEMARQIEEATK